LHEVHALCATADQIVTVSEHSKQDVMHLLGVEESRIAVTYQSVTLPETMLDRPDADVAREAREIEGVFGLDWQSQCLNRCC
jgi:hypothetical protein